MRLLADRDGPLLPFVVRRAGIAEELAKAAIERGGAFLQGRRVRDPDAPVRKGDRVEVSLRAQGEAPLSRERLLYLDELVLAIDKPAGVAAQEDLDGGAALPGLCSELLAGQGEKQAQVLLVHRLDRGTTGVTVLARTRRAQAALLEEFRERRAHKEYRALVQGTLPREECAVETPIESRPARTRFQLLERFEGASSVAAFPETGRTHQVRVHLRELGCPLLGDRLHGGPSFLTRADGRRLEAARPLLHALSLELRHPSGKSLRLQAPLPGDFEEAIRWLRR